MADRVRVGGTSFSSIEIAFVEKVLADNFIAPGEMTAHLERELAAAHGYKRAICLNSGQSALMISLLALRKMNEDRRFKVAVPAITYISTIAAVVQAGCEPLLVDVSKDARANMLYELVPDEADIVMPVHLFGRAIDEKYPFGQNPCVEDACEAAYAPGIGFGDACCLSFYSSHTITAGFGGAILTNDDDFAFWCWKLVNHGRIAHDDYTNTANLADRFTFDEFGYSLKFSDLNAAVGLGQHVRHTEIIQMRQTIGEIIINELQGLDWIEFPPIDNHTFMMLPIVTHGVDRDRVVSKLNQQDIETRMLMPITNQPIIRRRFGEDVDKDFPNARYLNEHGFYIGCHPNMTEEHVHRVVKTLKDY